MRTRLACYLFIVLLASSAFGAKLRQVAILDLPGRPGFDSIVFAEGKLVIAHRGANTVDIFDPAKRRLIGQVKGVDDPRGLTVDPAAHRLYIAAHGSNSIVVVNTTRWYVEGTMGLAAAPENLLLVPEERKLYATFPAERSIAVLSSSAFGQQHSELDTIALQGRPQHMAWDAEKKSLFVTLDDRGQIAELDPDAREHAVRKTIDLIASQPTGIVFDPNSRNLYVAVRYAIIQLTEDGAEIGRIPAPAGVDSLWLVPSAHMIYGAAANGTVVSVDVSGQRMQPQDEFAAGVHGRALAFDPQNKMVFLSGGREGISKIVLLKLFGECVQPQAGPVVAVKR
jgi:DNA-binding beta-propeller fold protein YncE